MLGIVGKTSAGMGSTDCNGGLFFMKSRNLVERGIAVTLSVLFITAVPVQAGTVDTTEVAQTAVNGTIGQAAYLDLSLRHLMQNPGSPVVAGLTKLQGGTNVAAAGSSKGAPQTPSTGDAAQGGGPTVETVDLGDVTGTVCDCGEILVPPVGGGFPKWPLLALAAIPLVFIKRGGGTINQVDAPQSSVASLVPPPPLPPSIIQPVPEPATLTLLGSSLIALGSIFRRRRRAGLNKADESGAETPQEVASC